MGKISNSGDREELTRWEENIWLKFLDNIEKAGSKTEIAKLLDSLLSANEKILISKRLAAMGLIKKGVSYKKIGRILWISPSTVSVIKKNIDKKTGYKSSRYYAAKSKSERMKKMKAFPPETILDYWFNLPMPKIAFIPKRKFRNR